MEQEALDPQTGDRQTAVDQLEQHEEIRRLVERQQEETRQRRQEDGRYCADGGKTQTLSENRPRAAVAAPFGARDFRIH